jgi:hypothetical protein
MALFSECMERCGKKGIDSAGVVREAMFRQHPFKAEALQLCQRKRNTAINRVNPTKKPAY